jgi:hypothetical protein
MISKMIVRRARAHPSYIGPDRAQRFVEQRGSPAGSLPSADLAGLSGVTHPHGRPLAGKPLPGARAATPAGRINVGGSCPPGDPAGAIGPFKRPLRPFSLTNRSMHHARHDGRERSGNGGGSAADFGDSRLALVRTISA